MGTGKGSLWTLIILAVLLILPLGACGGGDDGGDGDTEAPGASATERSTPSPSPTPEPISRDEGLDILPQMVLQLDDLPSGFEQVDSAFDSLDEEANRSSDPDRFRQQLESWGFVLGHDRFYYKESADGLFDVVVEVWLLEDEDGASEAFLDGGLYLEPEEGTVEPLDDFPDLGDASEAYTLKGPYDLTSGATIQADGYMIILRVGQFLAVMTTASPEGGADQAEALGLAQTLERNMQAGAR